MSTRSAWLLLATMLSSGAWAKGPVVRVEVRDGVHVPLVLTDAAVLEFDFVDSPALVARERAVGLPRVEVSFIFEIPRVGTREYIVAYEFDTLAGQGYVYLPRWENSLFWFGIEGHWLLASDRWDELVMPLVARHTSDGALSDGAKLRCGGIASVREDGSIAIQFMRDGARTSRWLYEPATEAYAEVAVHVGATRPGTVKAISCWPP